MMKAAPEGCASPPIAPCLTRPLGFPPPAQVIYKIDIPANRYDMLCLEGIARALNIFLGRLAPPQYRLADMAGARAVLAGRGRATQRAWGRWGAGWGRWVGPAAAAPPGELRSFHGRQGSDGIPWEGRM